MERNGQKTHTHTLRHLTEAETLTDTNHAKCSRERQFIAQHYFYRLHWQRLGNPPHHLLDRMWFSCRSVSHTATLRRELGIFLSRCMWSSPPVLPLVRVARRNPGAWRSGAVPKGRGHQLWRRRTWQNVTAQVSEWMQYSYQEEKDLVQKSKTQKTACSIIPFVITFAYKQN